MFDGTVEKFWGILVHPKKGWHGKIEIERADGGWGLARAVSFASPWDLTDTQRKHLVY